MKKTDKPKEQDAQQKPPGQDGSEKKSETGAAAAAQERREGSSSEQSKAAAQNQPLELKGNNGEENDDKYSDIDNKFEEKLKNNQVQEVNEDPFGDNTNKGKIVHHEKAYFFRYSGWC